MPTARYTAGDMIRAVRDNLDEAQPAFWTDAQIMRYLSRAARAVHTEIRKLKADYHLFRIASTDPIIWIFGESYDPAQLRITPGVTEYTLPFDCLEVKLIECITPGREGTVFDLSLDLTNPAFRGTRMNPNPQSSHYFLVDVVDEKYLEIAPRSNAPLDIRLHYVSACCIYSALKERNRDFTLPTDELVLPSPLYQAVEAKATAYGHLQDRNPSMAATWEGIANAAINRSMGADARQTQDPVFVEDWNP